MFIRFNRSNRLLAAAAAAGLLVFPSSANEGMWLFNHPPRQQLKEKYGFDATDGWLDHLQRSSVRFNSGGSGSFVSPNGLVMSNHHVGADALQKFGDKDHNYMRDGFHARSFAEEKPCLDLELNVLESVENVTDRVNAAVKPEMTAQEAFAARRAVKAEIEKESLAKTGLRSDVITLYQGGEYHLYRFKKYTDVRLVFAPEQQIAFYGGDPDNFEYPRYDLDICFFRAYENRKPVRPQNYLKWSPNGSADGDLVFVSGHPGRTSREMTVSELEYLRDVRTPFALQRLYRMEVLLTAYSARSAENARKAREELFGVQNSRKAYEGREAGLLDPEVMRQKREAETRFRARLASSEQWKPALSAWDRITQAQAVIRQHAMMYNYYEGGAGFQSALFGIARSLLRAAEERPKRNGDRLREFVDSAKESLEFQLFSAEPIYDDFERLKLAGSLEALAEQFGADDPLVQQVLQGKSPRERAAELIAGARVKDVAVRKKLYEGGSGALQGFGDPMIDLARAIDAAARAERNILDQEDEVKQQAYRQIAAARFALEGTSSYPDATFTLRLAYGVVKGYEEEGRAVPAFTKMAGLYERATAHQNQPPFDLPERWAKRKSRLNLETPFNFVSTADIIGGNSGSPVVNRAGELVGIIFDGNIQSLVLDFAYTETQARAVSVDSRAILEGLRKVCDASALADELTGKTRPR
jgi:hypothetical protein